MNSLEKLSLPVECPYPDFQTFTRSSTIAFKVQPVFLTHPDFRACFRTPYIAQNPENLKTSVKNSVLRVKLKIFQNQSPSLRLIKIKVKINSRRAQFSEET